MSTTHGSPRRRGGRRSIAALAVSAASGLLAAGLSASWPGASTDLTCAAPPVAFTTDALTASVWPGTGASTLLPELAPLCAVGLDPTLVTLMAEDMLAGGGFDSAGLGIVRDPGGDTLATVLAVHVPGLGDQVIDNGPGLRVTVNGVTVTWIKLFDTAAAAWVADDTLVQLTGDNAESLAPVVTAWLGAPAEAPVLTVDEAEGELLSPAFAAGFPRGDMPAGYHFLSLSQIAMVGSDLGDIATIFGKPEEAIGAGVDALGAGIVLDADGTYVATVLGLSSPALRDVFGTMPSHVAAMSDEPIPAEFASMLTVRATRTLRTSTLDIAIIGVDTAAVDALADAWDANLR